MKTRLGFIPLVCLGLGLAACSSASVGEPSGFLKDYSILGKGKYFKQEFIVPGANFSSYDSVKVAPIDFSYLIDKTAASSGDLDKLGEAFRQDIESALEDSGFRVTGVVTKKTLIIQPAITNVEFPDVAWNAATEVATSVLVPVPMPNVLDKDGFTAFEMKILDAATGNILIETSEKQKGSGPMTDLSVRGIKAKAVGSYTKFSNAEAVFGVWAKKIAKMLTELRQ